MLADSTGRLEQLRVETPDPLIFASPIVKEQRLLLRRRTENSLEIRTLRFVLAAVARATADPAQQRRHNQDRARVGDRLHGSLAGARAMTHLARA
jgi:hypothetical protein